MRSTIIPKNAKHGFNDLRDILDVKNFKINQARPKPLSNF